MFFFLSLLQNLSNLLCSKFSEQDSNLKSGLRTSHKDRKQMFANRCFKLSAYALVFTYYYAGINLTGYHPPGLTAGPLILPSKCPPRGQFFSAKLRPPGRKNERKSPPPGITPLVRMSIINEKGT